jgi:hypothetical protein
MSECRGGRRCGVSLNSLSAWGEKVRTTHDLKLHSLALEVDGADLEVDTNGGDVAFGVGVVGETEEKTRLANTRVTDKEKLKVSQLCIRDGKSWGLVSCS